MITACKSYITNGGCETVWTQPTDEVIQKLKDCIHLNDEYQVSSISQPYYFANIVFILLTSITTSLMVMMLYVTEVLSQD